MKVSEERGSLVKLSAPLAGHTAFVTGSGRYLGRGVALALAQAGAQVTVNARSNRAEAEGVVAEIEALGSKGCAVIGNVGSAEEVGRMVQEARAALGPIDILVHCAALRYNVPFQQLTKADLDQVMSVVLGGAFHLTKAIIDDMLSRRFGRIISIANTAAVAPRPQRAHVAAAKAALVGFTRAIAIEFAGSGITANNVIPTHFGFPKRSENSQRISRIPVGRAVRPEDVGGMCVYLASPVAEFVTGQTMYVNGGELLAL